MWVIEGPFDGVEAGVLPEFSASYLNLLLFILTQADDHRTETLEARTYLSYWAQVQASSTTHHQPS